MRGTKTAPSQTVFEVLIDLLGLLAELYRVARDRHERRTDQRDRSLRSERSLWLLYVISFENLAVILFYRQSASWLAG